jgi:DNA topoisomerase I
MSPAASKKTAKKIKALVIVESPTKANTISKYLGDDYEVEASVGHVRDLVTRKTDLSAKDKRRSKPWVNYGVNISNGFEPLEEIYRVPQGKKGQIDTLRKSLKNVDALYLATDDDREGEAISWHLVEELKPKVPIYRLVFREITKGAIASALASPRELDMDVVNAQRTRRIVDRLFGWDVSQILWRKIKPGLSAGRVQSVALRVLSERERQRIAFVVSEYWDLVINLAKKDDDRAFTATLNRVADKRVASGRDYDATTGALTNKKVLVLDDDKSAALRQRLESHEPMVLSREVKPQTRKPSAPFTTSTLQQEANRRLRFSAVRTMRIAQGLYEKGFITYMRTDSTTLSAQALNAAREVINERYGAAYLPEQPRTYATKDKNAQEAHEAIRPAGVAFTPPEDAAARLTVDEKKLYDLIWRRAVASQMNNAKFEQTTMEIGLDDAVFRANGRTVVFDGFMRVQGTNDDKDANLPPTAPGEQLVRTGDEPVRCNQHKTRPPARLNDATLVKSLEEKGIGRPSTYATIIQHLLDRGYCFRRANALVPTFMGMIVVRLLEDHTPHLVDYNFTAEMESRLDAIARGEADHGGYLRCFYSDGFSELEGGVKGLTSLLADVRDQINPAIASAMVIGTSDGHPVEVRIGRYGTFVRCNGLTASLPEDQAPDELDVAQAIGLIEERQRADAPIGQTPDGTNVYMKNGRFGWYVQLGEASGDEKPKMASLSKSMKSETVTLELAIRQLSLPREIGTHPDKNEVITAHVGRWGDYVKCGDQTATLPKDTLAIDVDVPGAVTALATKRVRGREKLRTIGVRADGVEIELWTGRWGPYVTDGKTNKTLGDLDPDTLTVEQSAEMIEAARIAKVGLILGKDPSNGEDVRLLDGRFGPYLTNTALNASLPRGATKDEINLTVALERLASHGKPVKKRSSRRGAAAKAKPKSRAKKAPAKRKTAGTKAAAKKPAAKKKKPAKRKTTKAAKKPAGTGSTPA